MSFYIEISFKAQVKTEPLSMNLLSLCFRIISDVKYGCHKMSHFGRLGWTILWCTCAAVIHSERFPTLHAELPENSSSTFFSHKLLVVTLLLPFHIWLLLAPHINNDTVRVSSCLAHLTWHVTFAGIQGSLQLDFLAQEILNSCVIQVTLVRGTQGHSVYSVSLAP